MNALRAMAGGLICCGLVFAAAPARAKLIEDIIDLPVRVTTVTGAVVEQAIKVTIFRDDARAKGPFLFINHGRAGAAEERAALGRARFGAPARFFVSLGFVVLAPTRIGYGVSGGPDVEFSGRCDARNYTPVYEAAAQQTLRVIEHAKTLSYVDVRNGVVLGQSFGGATALAVAAKNIPGVKAAVNFAGGGGGNPKARPADPCSPDRLLVLFAGYGATAKIPTLWLYSENDLYFGVEKPRRWFDAFRAKGGQGEFVTLPPFAEDGHRSFTGNPDAWRSMVEAFLRKAMGGALTKP